MGNCDTNQKQSTNYFKKLKLEVNRERYYILFLKKYNHKNKHYSDGERGGERHSFLASNH